MPQSMITLPRRTADLPLAANSCGRARRHVERWLDGVQVARESRQNVVLVVSELVANAVTHAVSAPTLSLGLDGDAVVVGVDDDDSTPPRRRRGGPEGGYGLGIVAQLAEHWGWTPTGRGKRVWARISLDEHRRRLGPPSRRPATDH